ncbi:MAG: YtfJ family protein [Acidobacteriota bacterium]|nr:YtfJ family protein [Acidobacteriota bacterium]
MTIVLLAALVQFVAHTTNASGAEVLDFELEDQFKNVHRSSDFSGHVVVLIGSDKNGVQFNGSWSAAIHDSLQDHPQYDQITHLAHADLRGVPFFLKGMIREKFPQNPDQWVLLDWKGKISKTYAFAADSSNILVFAPDGSLVHQASGQEPDDETVSEIAASLRTLLNQAGSGSAE